MLLALGHTTVQHFLFQFPEPSALRMLLETAEETWRRSFALIIAITLSIDYNKRKVGFIFKKSSGKIKSK